MIALIWGAIMLISNRIGRYFTEVRRPLYNFKPWNCRPCFTFWLTGTLGGIASGVLAAPAWWLYAICLAVSILCAFLNYFIIKSKIQIDE